jgi:translation initiation factor 3 subunit I
LDTFTTYSCISQVASPLLVPASLLLLLLLPLPQGHERPLTQVKYNAEGDLLVSCAKNLQPCLWYADDGRRVGTYEGHNGAVWSCEFTLDSERLITSSADQTVRIWDLPTGQELRQIRMNEPCR